MTDTEGRAHFSMWAIMAAPLIAGNDLRSMSNATKTTMTNADVIAIDQDPLGSPRAARGLAGGEPAGMVEDPVGNEHPRSRPLQPGQYGRVDYGPVDSTRSSRRRRDGSRPLEPRRIWATSPDPTQRRDSRSRRRDAEGGEQPLRIGKPSRYQQASMPLRRDMLPSHLRMAVPPRCPEASPGFRRIIVCLDLSAECDDALQSLAAVAAGTDVMLELVYIIDVFTETFVQSNGRRSRGSALSKERSRALCATDSRRYALRESGALPASSSGCRRLRSRATSSGPQPISSSWAADIVSATRPLRGLDWQQRASSAIRPGDAYTRARAATRAPSRLEMRRTAASRRASSAGRAVRGRHTERRISCAAPLAARGSSRQRAGSSEYRCRRPFL